MAEGAFLIFVPTPSGYELVEHAGETPQAGDELTVNDLRVRVTKIAPSPLPADARTCAYVETIG